MDYGSNSAATMLENHYIDLLIYIYTAKWCVSQNYEITYVGSRSFNRFIYFQLSAERHLKRHISLNRGYSNKIKTSLDAPRSYP